MLFVVDAQIGITPGDEEVAQILRESKKPVLVIANKIDEPAQETLALELHRLGLGDPIPISGAARPRHRRPARRDRRLSRRTERGTRGAAGGGDPRRDPRPPERRQVDVRQQAARPGARLVSEIPGTTRDAIDTVLERGDRTFVLVDTAGLRRKRAPSAGHRVLLGAARARSGGAGRRRARPDRRGGGHRRPGSRRRRHRAQGRLRDADRAREVGRRVGRPRRRAPPAARRLRQRPAVHRGLGEDRPRRSSACSTTSRCSSSATRSASRRPS